MDAIQNYYPDQLSYCYGCGRLNEAGLQIKSYWDGEETVCVFTPHPHHIALPGYVYGGLIASLIDCHGTATAAAAAYHAQGRAMDTDPPLRFVTASLKVDYLKPTPLGPPLELRGRASEVKGRKVVVEITLATHSPGDRQQGGLEPQTVFARGTVVAVQVTESFLASLADHL